MNIHYQISFPLRNTVNCEGLAEIFTINNFSNICNTLILICIICIIISIFIASQKFLNTLHFLHDPIFKNVKF